MTTFVCMCVREFIYPPSVPVVQCHGPSLDANPRFLELQQCSGCWHVRTLQCHASTCSICTRKLPQEGCVASSFGVWGHSAGMAVCHAIHLWVFVASKSQIRDRIEAAQCCLRLAKQLACGLWAV